MALRKMTIWQLYNDTSNDIIWRRGWTTDDGQISIKKSSLLSSEDSRLWVITDLTLAWNKQEIGTPLRQFTLPEAIKKISRVLWRINDTEVLIGKCRDVYKFSVNQKVNLPCFRIESISYIHGWRINGIRWWKYKNCRTLN